MVQSTDRFGEAPKDNEESWVPIPDGTKVFDVVSKDGKEVRVGTIIDDPKKSGDYLGCIAEDYQECPTRLVRLDPKVIRKATRHKHYVILDCSPRFVLPA